MKFWDTSALVPLVTKEEQTPIVQRLLGEDGNVAVSFITPVELTSTIWRRGRRWSDQTSFRRSLFKIAELEANWTSLDEHDSVIKLARQLITQHVLRTGDATSSPRRRFWPADTRRTCHSCRSITTSAARRAGKASQRSPDRISML